MLIFGDYIGVTIEKLTDSQLHEIAAGALRKALPSAPH
jgi:hypothetical protein